MQACVLLNKELPFLRDYSTGASQNRENKLESQEEKSFMSDALITKKQAGLRKVQLVGLYFGSSWGQLDTKISNNGRCAHE